MREKVRERKWKVMGKLSSKFVENIRVKGRYYDGCGLILFVGVSKESVSKSWVVRYTSPKTKVRRDMGLGPVEMVGLAAARQLAAKAIFEVTEGIDPLETHNAQRVHGRRPLFNQARVESTSDFESIVRAFHATHKVTLKNPKYADQWLRNIERLTFKQLGKIRIDQLTTVDLASVMQPIALKTSETARRVIIQLTMIFADACARGVIRHNPADPLKILIKYPPSKKSNHPSLHWEKAPKFVADLVNSELANPVKFAYLFLILTAARSAEVLNAKWNEIVGDQSIWEIPAERMKTSKSHRVWLPTQATALLEQLKRQTSSEYVFCGSSSSGTINSNSLLNATKILGYKGTLSPHGCRATFSTWANENEVASPEVIETALAHSIGDAVSRAYNKADYGLQRQKLMQTWADFVLSEVIDFLPNETKGA
jgi:integrase